MKLESLGEFIVLAKYMNFSKAAQELYLSQPGLSTHISNLEKELGFSLIDRSRGKPVLTPAGSMFLQYAQKVLSTYDEGYEKCRLLSKEPPPLRIASVPAESEVFRVLSEMKEFSFVFVDLDFDTSTLLALEKDLIDVGIGYDFRSLDDGSDELYRFWAIGYERAALGIMATHRLASKEHLRREDLAGLTVTINSGTHFDRWRESILNMLGRDAGLSFRLDTIGSLTNLAFIDLGETAHICGLDTLLEHFRGREDVVVFDTLDNEPMRFPMGIIYRKDRFDARIERLGETLAAQVLSA